MTRFTYRRVSYSFVEARQFLTLLRSFQSCLLHLNSLYEFIDDAIGTAFFFTNDIPDGYEAARDNCLRFGNELLSFLGISEPLLIGESVQRSSGVAELLRLSECTLTRQVGDIMRCTILAPSLMMS